MPAVIGLSCVAVLIGLALVGLVLARTPAGTPTVYGGSLCVTTIAFVGAIVYLVNGAPPVTLTLPVGLPGLGSHFRIDPLATFFLLVVNLGGAAASLYALGYGRHETAPLRVLPFFPVFIGAMNLVVLADDAFTFLLSWEFMSLSSWALVVSHHQEPANQRAGYVYLLMASFGTLALLLAFGLLSGGQGNYAFAAIRSADTSTLSTGLVLVLVLLGAGSKAGLVPLHVWLPLAHPAAPSHVSALLSGVMTKIGIYGFIRIIFDLTNAPAPWWSMAVLALAGITAVLGVLYALMQQDLKRLLACSTIENIGIIFIGLGLALAFQVNNMAWAAALALTAALFHVLNHSVFKSLLFFGAGAVLTATKQRDMECLGGLIHRMPRTAIAFLVGCAAISALPPLNGFVSEWLAFQAILVGAQVAQWPLKFLLPAVGAALALSAALAAACFVKAFGIVFLGRPRSKAAEAATEVDPFSLSAMFILAGICLLAGVLPGLVIDFLAPVVSSLTADRMPLQTAGPWLSIVPMTESRSSYNGMIILLFVVSAGTLTAAFIHRFATRATRRSAAWDCGYPLVSPTTQYTGSSFAMPIRNVFGATVFQVREKIDMPRPGEIRVARFQVKVFDPVWRFAYGPLARAIWKITGRLNVLQFMTVRRYLTLTVSTLILLLLVVAIWR